MSLKLSRRKALGLAAGMSVLPVLNKVQAAGTPAQASGAAAAAAPAAKGAYKASTAEKKLNIVSLERLEEEAKKVIPEAGFAFVSGAAGDEWTLRENRRAYDDYRIASKRLVGLARENVDLRTRLLGHDLPYPIIVAPMGVHGMVHLQAETDTAKGAGLAGTLYTSSGASHRPLEQIAKATSGPKWFQLYFNADEGITIELLQRARAAGYSAIVLTADALGPGQPDNFLAMGSPFRPDMGFGNHDPKFGGRGNFLNQKVNLTLKDIEFVKKHSGLPVVVKGLLRADNAVDSVRAGADAIQVSNHGGRQIDGVPASVTVLPKIATAVNNRVPVILDGGIRRGIDVVRALALGADTVALGRPCLYGLALGGAQGVQSVLEHLRNETQLAMLLAGAAKIADLSPDYLDIVGENAGFFKRKG